jgi:hypothetical protein
MVLPITIKGNVKLQSVKKEPLSIDFVLNHISSALFSQGATVEEVSDSHIQFTRPFVIFELNWKPLSFVSKGDIHVFKNGEKIWAKYDISYKSLYVFNTIFFVIWGLLFTFASDSRANAIVLIIGLWAFSITINLLIYNHLFRRFLTQSIKEANSA